MLANPKSKIQNLKLSIYKSPYFYIAIGVIFLILAAFLHPFDLEYKDFVQSLRASYSRINILDLIRVIGKGEYLIFAALVLGAIKYKALACKILLAFLIMSVIVWCIKVPVHRERPNNRDHFSFPSGDSATSSALAASISSQLPVIGIPAAVAAGAVAFLRNYDNYHYLSDALAGLGFGILSTGLALFIKLRKFRLFWKIKPAIFKWVFVLLFLIYSLPRLFNWAFLVWLILGALIILHFTIREKKLYDNASKRS